MDKHDELAGLEKQLADLEGQIDKALDGKALDGKGDGDGAAKTKKRYRPGDLTKAKKKADDGDDSDSDEYDDLADDDGDDDEDDMDKRTKDKVAKADDKTDKAADKTAKAADKAADKVAKAADDKAVKSADDKTAKAADDTLTVDGQVIRKADVGDAQFAIFKSMSERLAKSEALAKSERDARELAELSKRASDEFSGLPTSIADTAAILKAIAPLDEGVRKNIERVFTAHQKLTKMAFETFGHNPANLKASGDFLAKVAEIKKRDNCTQSDAMAKARVEHPDEFKSYQDSAN